MFIYTLTRELRKALDALEKHRRNIKMRCIIHSQMVQLKDLITRLKTLNIADWDTVIFIIYKLKFAYHFYYLIMCPQTFNSLCIHKKIEN